MFASLSILGLYQYDDTIFDKLTLPAPLDKDTLLPLLLTECSDFPLLYGNPSFMKDLIGAWSDAESTIWANLAKSEHFEYNPIENFDRYEDITRTTVTQNDSSTTNHTGTTSTTKGKNDTVQTNMGKSLQGKTAYDSDTLKDVQQVKNDQTTANTGNNETQTTDSADGTATGSNKTHGSEIVSTHLHGNIGVTTAQQMIEGFRNVSMFSTYNYIVDSFKNRFCVQVY